MNWLNTLKDKVIDRAIEVIEEKGRKIERRGDALLGCNDYEGSTTSDRISALAGHHDNGTYTSQRKKKSTGIEPGDIICVSRKLYDHYGIYINKEQTISYTSETSDIGGNVIVSTTLERFLRGENKYSVLVFPDKHGTPDKVQFQMANQSIITPSKQMSNVGFFKSENYQIYSPKETIQRAKSRLHEDDYSIIFNNCEHFAIWCKTGITESHQVNSFLGLIKHTQFQR